MSRKFNSFKQEVIDLTRSELQTDIEDLTDVNEETMKEYFLNGQSPSDFFAEQVEKSGDKPLDAYTEDEFDPRYEL